MSTVVVTHRYSAPFEYVFQAWIEPETAKRFLFATDEGTIVRTDIDARPGGKFLIVDRRDGEDIEHVGEYLVVDPPSRLEFTFSVPKFSAEPTTVRLTFEPRVEGTYLTLTHEGVLEDWAERTEHGWKMILDNLEKVLA